MDRFAELAQGAHALHVELAKGDLTVRADAEAGWTLEWKGSGSPEVECVGAVLRVRSRRGWLRRRLDLRLTLPPGVGEVRLGTGQGSIEASGLSGDARIKSGKGAVTLRACSGATTLETGAGALRLDGYEGTITATTGSGQVRAARLRGEATLETGSGPVELRETEGRLRAKTGSGNVTLANAAGEATLSTGSGNVSIEASRDLAAKARTSTGSIRVRGGTARGLDLQTKMGEIRCTALPRPGRYELDSAAGSIQVELPAWVAARVEAHARAGQVRSDFPLVSVGRSGPMARGGARMVGSIGDGEPRADLSLRTLAGTITLRRAKTAPPRGHERKQRRYGSTLAVLEALARGELDPEEADALLARLAERVGEE